MIPRFCFFFFFLSVSVARVRRSLAPLYDIRTESSQEDLRSLACD